MWQWISSTQTPELVRGLTTSRDIATERAEAAEAEVRRLTVLLRDMGVRSHDTEKRLWAAQEDILSLDDALARATRYRQEAAQWMDHAHRLLSELLPTLGPPPTPPLHWRD